jgi:shikimate dehydrogenase
MEPGGRHVVVLGAGGAARAITDALGRADARVTVAARRLEAAQSVANLAAGAAATAIADVDEAIGRADVIVNATPVGMAGEQPPFDVTRLHEGQLVVDTVYHPSETPLLAAARARGARATNGIGMLVHQASLAFRIFTGRDAPIEVMRAAAAEQPA